MRVPSAAGLAAAGLFGLGVLVTEAQFYAIYASDASFLVNVNFVVGVLLAGCAAVAVVLLLTAHEVGGGAVAVVMGALLVLILLGSRDPRYYAPPFLEVAGGMVAIFAQALKAGPVRLSGAPPQ